MRLVVTIIVPSPIVTTFATISAFTRYGFFRVLVFSAVVLVGCSQLTPSETARQALLAANAGRYDEADGHLDSSLRDIEKQDGGSKLVWDANTRSRTITTIAVVNDVETGQEAQMELHVTYSRSCPAVFTVQLRHGLSGWVLTKISSSPSDPACPTH